MPSLPTENHKGQFDFLNKPIPNPSDLIKAQLVANRSHLKLPKKLIAFLLALVVILVAVYVGFTFVYPQLTKKKPQDQAVIKPFEYPVNVAEIKFPSDILKQKFLENIQKASKETDEQARYKLLEDDFVLLRTFYTSTADFDFRGQLDKFKQYMQNNYPQNVQVNRALYDFPCVDKFCTGGETPAEIKTISYKIFINTVMNAGVKDTIGKNLDAASFNKNKTFKLNAYMGVLSMLVSEFKRTNDVEIKTISKDLSSYIIQSYPEMKIPKELQI